MSNLSPIVTLPLEAIPSGGDPISFTLQVGAPFQEDEQLWRCVVEMDGFERPARIAGVDSFQALCLAIDFARWTLRVFQEGGGRLIYQGEYFDLNAFHFKAPD